MPSKYAQVNRKQEYRLTISYPESDSSGVIQTLERSLGTKHFIEEGAVSFFYGTYAAAQRAFNKVSHILAHRDNVHTQLLLQTINGDSVRVMRESPQAAKSKPSTSRSNPTNDPEPIQIVLDEKSVIGGVALTTAPYFVTIREDGNFEECEHNLPSSMNYIERLKALEATFGERRTVLAVNAVIAVPSYLGITERLEVWAATKQTAVTGLRLITSPTAACLWKAFQNWERKQSILAVEINHAGVSAAIAEFDAGILEILSDNGKSTASGTSDDARLQLVGELVSNSLALSACDAIDEVVVCETGNSVSRYKLSQLLKDFTGCEVDYRPDAVARGATLQSQVLMGVKKGLIVLDVTPTGIGIKFADDLIDVIPHGMPRPLQHSVQIDVRADGNVELDIIDLGPSRTKIGSLEWRGLKVGAEARISFNVIGELDAAGNLTIEVTAINDGIRQRLSIKMD